MHRRSQRTRPPPQGSRPRMDQCPGRWILALAVDRCSRAQDGEQADRCGKADRQDEPYYKERFPVFREEPLRAGSPLVHANRVL